MIKALADEQSKIALFADLKKTFTNKAIICETMTQSELMQLIMCRELMKAMHTKKYTLVHDSNIENSKAQSVQYQICTYQDDAQKRVLHIYADSKNVSISFSAKDYINEKVMIAKQLKNAYHIQHKYKSKAEKTIDNIKDNYIKVHFDDVINASKFALFILENTIEDLQAMLDAENAE